MCSACTSCSPAALKSAAEQSARSLMFGLNAARRSTAPISSAMPSSRPISTARPAASSVTVSTTPTTSARARTGATGASRSTPNVPLKSRSPSANTVPPRSAMPRAVATEVIVTPAHAASACSSMSPEHANDPSPPVAGCRPARTKAWPVSTEQLMPSVNAPCACNVITAALGSSRYCCFKGACSDFSSCVSTEPT